jgi:hypothetical protein
MGRAGAAGDSGDNATGGNGAGGGGTAGVACSLVCRDVAGEIGDVSPVTLANGLCICEPEPGY